MKANAEYIERDIGYIVHLAQVLAMKMLTIIMSSQINYTSIYFNQVNIYDSLLSVLPGPTVT